MQPSNIDDRLVSGRDEAEATETLSPSDLEKIVKFFLPHFVKAGDKALEMQPTAKNIGKQFADKQVADGVVKATDFTTALTPSDIEVQKIIEEATLANPEFSNFSFEGEENSPNKDRFPADKKYLFALDPINWTTAYKDNLKIFEIMFTIFRQSMEGSQRRLQTEAAVVYAPAKGCFYIGIKGRGAFKTTKDAVTRDEPWEEHRLQSGSNAIMTYRCSKEMLDSLGKVMNVRDMKRDYSPAFDVSLHSLHTGDLDAFAKQHFGPIDWGTTAFIAEQAGGTVSDFEGRPIADYRLAQGEKVAEARVPSVVAAATQEIHQRIIKALAEVQKETPKKE